MDRVPAGNGMSFRVGFTGHSGHLRFEPLPPVEGPNPLRSLPDFVLPPAFEQETTESVKRFVEANYLSPVLDPDEFSVEKSGRQWDFDWFDRAKIPLDPSIPRTVVVPQWELPFRRKKDAVGVWHPDTVEMDITKLMEGDQISGSLPRMPGSAKDFVKGATNSRPFRPGGLEDSHSLERVIPEGARTGEWVREILDGCQPQTVPPGFKQGMDLGGLKELPISWKCAKEQILAASSPSMENLDRLSVRFDYLFQNDWEANIDNKLEDKLEGEKNMPDETIDKKNMPDEREGEKNEECFNGISPESSVLDEILVNDVRMSSPMPEISGPHKEVLISEPVEDIDSNFDELVPDKALEFPFDLDRFQKEAIYYLEKGESVFVAAHTSAGKTVVAEYAFALASKHCTKAIYTAPIKTISNQKYRDFCGKFDVGLLTGDVSLKPEASCLIMTTEILRSMLYKGADIIRDIEWVIFDEVHYVNDVERGVVWEEIIIMLPRHVNIVLLSATVPNTREFADWIGRTKQKKIRVTGTLKRPVPLEHCLFYSNELYKICENETFLPQGFKLAKDMFKKKILGSAVGSTRSSAIPAASAAGGNSRLNVTSAPSRGGGQARQHNKPTRGGGHKSYGSENTNAFHGTGGGNQSNRGSWRAEATIWLSLVNKLLKKSLLPVVIFCFSKNRCDKSADNLTGIDLTSSSEKSQIHLFCNKAFSRLKGSDRNLPQIVRVESLLRRGIGVHHAGLLPIVKEVVEMLFCRGVIKVLFSTETFAMGVNAPARTVVFDTLRKFDGKDFRSLLSGEYIQMAGRAGRRGLDNIGTVAVMCRDEIPEERDLKRVMLGTPTRLESQFRLRYTMILHLLRLEELKVEDMLKRSFAEFHAQTKLPEKAKKLRFLKESQLSQSIECIKGEPAIEEYFELASEAEELRDHISEAVMQSPTAQQFLSPGRVVVVRSKSVEDHLFGVVLKAASVTSKQYIVLVLTTDSTATRESSLLGLDKLVGKDSGNSSEGYFIPPKKKRDLYDDEYSVSTTSRKGSGIVNIKPPYCGSAAGINYEVLWIERKEFLSICNSKIRIDQVRLLEEPSSAAYSKTVQELLEQKPTGCKYPPALDPIRDLKMNQVDIVKKYHHYNDLLQKMAVNKCHGCIKLKEHMALMKDQKRHNEEVNALKYQMSDEALQHMPDFQGRIDVLKEIGCIDCDLVVQIKGRVACEMNSGEELICTECLFENQLEDLEPEEAVAIMSAFVFQQKNTSEPNLSPKLSSARKRLLDIATSLGKLQADFNVAVDPEEYVQENLKFGLVEVVYEWAKGTPFADICELTDVPEGLIVRTIVRLDETCREFKNAASIMGNSALYKKMEIASDAIKRDIVFAASLYVTGV